MKIDVFYYGIEEYIRDGYEVEVDGKPFMRFRDGEPEDNNLNRNFDSVYSIPKLIRAVHESGMRGESLEIREHSHNPDNPDDCVFCLSSN